VLRVGLTGGIASGKSRVLRRLAERGCRTLDLDAVARHVTEPGSPALAEITAAFGSSVLDARGALDRAALAAVVFGDAVARQQLDAIVHPRVREAERAWAADFADRSDAVLVTDGALLIESGVHLRFDRLVVVHCTFALQLARLRERDGFDERQARARIEAQLPSAEKRRFAHFEIDTSGSLDETDRATDALATTLASLARDARETQTTPLEPLLGGLVHGPEHGPRGLSPALLLAEAAAAGGLELARLAARLVPPARGPWYLVAAESRPEVPACRLSVALTAWALRRRGSDADFLAAAAASVARLTHSDPGERTDACLVALVAQQRAVAAPGATELGALAARALPLAARFGAGPPTGRLEASWAALRRFPADPAAAGALGASLGGDAPTTSALAGLGQDVSGAPQAQAWRRVLED